MNTPKPSVATPVENSLPPRSSRMVQKDEEFLALAWLSTSSSLRPEGRHHAAYGSSAKLGSRDSEFMAGGRPEPSAMPVDALNLTMFGCWDGA